MTSITWVAIALFPVAMGCSNNGGEQAPGNSADAGDAESVTMRLCTPKAPSGCTCPDGSAGSKVCSDDGTNFGVCDCAPTRRTDEPIVAHAISPSPLSAMEAETHISVAPNGYVASAWIDIQSGGSSTNGYAFSKDRGATWEAVQAVDSPGGRISSDPVLAVDGSSNFYMVWIGFHRGTSTPTDMAAYASVAPAGTTTFGPPVQISDPLDPSTVSLDKPWITVVKDTILATYTKFETGGSETIFAARSLDGQTWRRSTVASGFGQRNLAMPCTAGGRVWVVFWDDAVGFAVHWSDDRGATWPVGNVSSVGSASAGVFDDPSCVASSDTSMWVEYETSAAGGTGAASAIAVARSTNGGVSFDAPVIVQDTVAAYHAQLAIEPGGTAIDLVYYGGTSESDRTASYRHARSTNGGVSFSPSVVIKQPLTFLTNRMSAQWLGDYVGVVVSDGQLFTSFTDNTTPAAHVWFARVALP